MTKGQKETITIRAISVSFVVLALAIFKPFGLDTWHLGAYAHLLVIGVLGFCVCMLTDIILKYVVRMPRSTDRGASYIIRRNLWFQIINTPMVALVICLYRHIVFSDQIAGNRLSWGNFLETLLIIAFCSFAIGLYWRFKFRARYLALELEETRLLNEQLQKLQKESTWEKAHNTEMINGLENIAAEDAEEMALSSNNTTRKWSEIVLKGTTNESVKVSIPELLYIEAVGNYVKVSHLCDNKVHTDMLRATMKQMEDDLRGFPMIVRCHRAFLVNLQQVERVVAKAGTMQLIIRQNHESIPVSRSNMSQVKESIKRI